MTKFNHQPRNGRRRKPKTRKRQSMGPMTLEDLVMHRELEYLRAAESGNKGQARICWAKLRQARTALERARESNEAAQPQHVANAECPKPKGDNR